MTMSNDNDSQRSGDTNAASGTSGPNLKLIALLVMVGIAVTFVLQNRDRKSIDFLVFEINSRQWVNIAAAIAIGIVLDRLFLGWWRRRKSDKNN